MTRSAASMRPSFQRPKNSLKKFRGACRFRRVAVRRSCEGHPSNKNGRAPSQLEGDTTMSRYMLIMRSTPEAEKAMAEQNIDFNEIIESMGRYNEELIKAGVMLAGEGLTGPDEGFVVDFDWIRRSSPTARTPRPRSCSMGFGSSTCRRRKKPS